MVGVAAEAHPQPQAQDGLKRGQPFLGFDHGHRNEHADGVRGQLVHQGQLLPLLLHRRARLAPTEMAGVATGRGGPRSFHDAAMATRREPWCGYLHPRNLDRCARALDGAEVEKADPRLAGQFGPEGDVKMLERLLDLRGVDVDGGDSREPLAFAFVGLVEHAGLLLAVDAQDPPHAQQLMAGAEIGDANARAPRTADPRGLRHVEGAVAAVGAQPPRLQDGFGRRADIEGVNQVPVAFGVVRVARRELAERELRGAVERTLVAELLTFAVDAPQHCVETNGFVGERVVGQQTEPLQCGIGVLPAQVVDPVTQHRPLAPQAV